MREVGRTIRALAISGGVNTVIVLILSLLNFPEPIEVLPVRTPTRIVSVPEKPAEKVNPRPASEPSPPDPAPMTFFLDHPPLALEHPEPVPLPMTIPNPSLPSSIRVHAGPLPIAGSREHKGAEGGPADGRTAPGIPEAPRELVGLQPEYPRIARNRGLEGSVEIKVLIDESGRVEEVEVLQSQGHESFRQAVRKAVRGWRFRPAQLDGLPVKAWAVKRIEFRMEE